MGEYSFSFTPPRVTSVAYEIQWRDELADMTRYMHWRATFLEQRERLELSVLNRMWAE